MNLRSIYRSFGLTARLSSALQDVRRDVRGLGLRAFAWNALTFSAGTLGAQLIGFAIMPFVTRLYGTAAFGIYSVFVSVSGILAPIVCLRLDFAVPMPASRRLALALTQAACLSGLGLSFLLAAVAFAVSGPLGVRMFGEVSPYLWWGLGIALPAQALQLVFIGWNVREGEFRTLSFSQITSALVGCTSQLIGGFVGAGPSGLIAGMAVGWWASAAVQSRTAVQALRRRHVPSLRLMRRATIAYKQFLIWTMPSSVVNTLGVQLVPVLVVALYGAKSGGLFYLAYRIVALPLGLIGTGLGRVMWGEIARMRRDRPEKLRPLCLVVFFGTLILTAPGLLFLPFSREIFAFALGRQWGDAGALATILFFSAWIGVAANTSSKLPVLGYNHWQTGWEIMRLAVTIAIAAAAATWHLSLIHFVTAITVGWSFSYLVMFALNLMAIGRTERGERSLMSAN
jgi:O-antigen/teichoic acid export membrane protein